MTCCLTLVLPRAFEEELVDHLLEHPEWVPGFTTFPADGHGHGLVFRDSREEVRGRTARRVVQIVTEEGHAEALVAHLRETLANAEVTWWITPVTAFGRLA